MMKDMFYNKLYTLKLDSMTRYDIANPSLN